MNKTVTANISGIVFHIEVEAYEKLSKYLKAIRSYFQGSEGEEEIMADIEARIAELFKSNGKDVVNMQEVDQVVEIMGEPEQYMDEDAKVDNDQRTYSSDNNNFRSRKLFRDVDDAVIGGVCSGLGYYFGVDRIWFRAAFLITLFLGPGFLIYLIFWIIVPGANNTAEKLEMKGEPVNVNNIGNSIKEEFNSFKQKMDENGAEGAWNQIRNAFLHVIDFFSKLLLYAFKFGGKALALFILIIAGTALLGILGVAFSSPFDIQIDDVTIQSIEWITLADLFFRSSPMFWVLSIGVFLFISLPLLALVFVCFKFIFKLPYSARSFGIVSTALWVIALIAIFAGGTWIAADFSSQHKIEENIALDQFTSDTLILGAKKDDLDQVYFISGIKMDEKNIYYDELIVDIIQSETDEMQLKLEKCARGRNREVARNNARATKIDFELIDNKLNILPLWFTPKKQRFRAQTVEVHIELPVGKTIYLAPSSRPIIYDIKNVSRTYDGDMIGHHWMMTEQGLKCTDCPWLHRRNEGEVEEND